MKRIIRLTESDLARIVRRVISEGFAENTVFVFIVISVDNCSFFAINLDNNVKIVLNNRKILNDWPVLRR